MWCFRLAPRRVRGALRFHSPFFPRIFESLRNPRSLQPPKPICQRFVNFSSRQMSASLIPPEDSIRVPIPLLSHLASRGSLRMWRHSDFRSANHGFGTRRLHCKAITACASLIRTLSKNLCRPAQCNSSLPTTGEAVAEDDLQSCNLARSPAPNCALFHRLNPKRMTDVHRKSRNGGRGICNVFGGS